MIFRGPGFEVNSALHIAVRRKIRVVSNQVWSLSCICENANSLVSVCVWESLRREIDQLRPLCVCVRGDRRARTQLLRFRKVCASEWSADTRTALLSRVTQKDPLEATQSAEHTTAHTCALALSTQSERAQLVRRREPWVPLHRFNAITASRSLTCELWLTS